MYSLSTGDYKIQMCSVIALSTLNSLISDRLTLLSYIKISSHQEKCVKRQQ